MMSMPNIKRVIFYREMLRCHRDAKGKDTSTTYLENGRLSRVTRSQQKNLKLGVSHLEKEAASAGSHFYLGVERPLRLESRYC